VFFYLATIVPCVWILELNLLSNRINLQAQSNVTLLTILKQLNNSWLGSQINHVSNEFFITIATHGILRTPIRQIFFINMTHIIISTSIDQSIFIY